MKNFLKKLATLFLLMNLALTIQIFVVHAQTSQPQTPPAKPDIPSPLEYLKSIGQKTKLPNFVDTGVHPEAAAETMPGVSAATSPIYFAIDMFRYAVSAIAFVIIIIAAMKLVTTANDEEAGKAKKSLLMGIIGLLIIQLADFAVKQAFFGEQGEAFEDKAAAINAAQNATNQLRGVIGFLEAFLGASAVLVIVIKGFTLITSGGEEEQLTKTKTHLIYAVVGLVIVGLSEIIVRGFIFPEQGSKLPDINVGKKLIVDITNFMASFIAIFAFIMLFISGYRYVISGGEDEVKDKVKKTIFGAIIALLLALGAYAAVNTLVKLNTADEVETEEIPADI